MKKLILLLGYSIITVSLAVSQDKAISWFQRGVEAKTPQDKINCYEKAIEIDPNFVEAYYNLAYVYKELDDLVNAEQYFRKALFTNPEKISNELKLKITYELGINYKKLGRYAEAEEALLGAKNLATNYEIRSKIFYELGRIYMLISEYDKAIVQFTEGAQLNGRNQQKFNVAIESAQKEREINSFYTQGIQLEQASKNQEAIDAFSNILLIDPNYKDVAVRLNRLRNSLNNQQAQQNLKDLYARGLGYFKNQAWQNAIEAFEEVVKINPNYEDTPQKLAEAKLRLEKSFQEETIETYYEEGLVAYRQGKWVNAIVAFEKVKELNPNFKDVNTRIREVQSKLDREDENLVLSRYYSQGIEALAADDWRKAIASFERVLQVDPNYRDVTSKLKEARIGLESEQEMDKIHSYYTNGLAEFNRGEWLKAIIEFEKVNELDPQFKDIGEKIAQAKANLQASDRNMIVQETKATDSKRFVTIGAIITAIIVPVISLLLFSPTTRAKFLLLQGKYDRASRIYEQLLYKRPEKIKLYITLANIYLIDNRIDEAAIRVYETVLQMNISPQLKQRVTSIVQRRYGDKDKIYSQRIDLLEDELRREMRNLGGGFS